MTDRRIAIVGDEASVAGFRPLGFDVFPVDRPDDAREQWAILMAGDYGVIFVTEQVYSAIEDLAVETADRPTPAVTVIPGSGRGGGLGAARLDRAIERALGTSVPHREEED